MACCRCCCGRVDCTEGQGGKCCCGDVCCGVGEYCCGGECQAAPCNTCPEVGPSVSTVTVVLSAPDCPGSWFNGVSFDITRQPGATQFDGFFVNPQTCNSGGDNFRWAGFYSTENGSIYTLGLSATYVPGVSLAIGIWTRILGVGTFQPYGFTIPCSSSLTFTTSGYSGCGSIGNINFLCAVTDCVWPDDDYCAEDYAVYAGVSIPNPLP